VGRGKRRRGIELRNHFFRVPTLSLGGEGNIDLSGVRGGKDVTERNSGTVGRGLYTVTGCCVVSIRPECAGEHMLIM
jgi:hypothetical protein